MVQTVRTFYIGHKTLHKYAIQAILLHPFKMQVNAAGIVGAEHIRRAAIGMLKRRFIRFCIFPYIWPKIYFSITGLKLTTIPIMEPASVSAIFRGIEPALIA